MGELCFGGSQVFRGYLNRPELNAAKIIDHPFHGRIYRSGDMGILLPDDSILFTGRMDDQVKVRGQRVELREITSIVLDQEGVHDCTTLLLHGNKNSQRLVTFWVPRSSKARTTKLLEAENHRSTVTTLFAELLRCLPSYMVPSHLIPVSLLPMTVQGKIDKRHLQALFEPLTETSLAPFSEVYDDAGEMEITDAWESQVAQVLAETLGDARLGNIARNSSFYSLGLDSVSAISFSNKLRQAKLGDFALSTILKHPTIELLAAAKEIIAPIRPNLDAPIMLQEVFAPQEVSRLRKVMEPKGLLCSKILPCTPLQEAMLSTNTSSEGAAYSNVMVFNIHGDLSRLQYCWARMAQRHDILRTAFLPTTDPSYAFAQVVLKDANIEWGDLKPADEIQPIANKAITSLLEGTKPPVWLAQVRSSQSTKILFCCHHALYDGIAINNLLNEVQDMFHGHTLPSPLLFETHLRRIIQQDFVKADKFWSTTFENFEPTYFPNLTGRLTINSRKSASWSQRLQIPLTEARSTCQHTSTSLLALIQASWAKILHLYTSESDICFGNVVSGRNTSGEDIGRLVAPCFNTLPVRIDFEVCKRNEALLKTLHDFNVESLNYQLTPLRRIQNIALGHGGRLFDTLVLLQQPNVPLDDRIWTLEEDIGQMDLPLVCEVFPEEEYNSLRLVLHYHNSILSMAEAEIVAKTFDTALASMIKQPQGSAFDAFSIPPELRSESNMNFKKFDVDTQFIHSGFEHNVTSKPEHIALDFIHGDGSKTIWSFKDLDEKANSIAHVLLRYGTEKEDIVPIHISKSPLFYACILGVLKAGAAFSPIHPDLPESRKRLMLEDLGAKIILYSGDVIPPSSLGAVEAIDISIVADTKSSPYISNLSGSNLAYCLFTSGSTGTPKAVSVEHGSPIQTIESSRPLIPWDARSRLLQYAAVTFDMCYYDCFLAWTLGFTLCAAEQQMMLNDLTKTINDLDVDLLDLTPSVAVSLRRSEVPKVKWLYCIGEAMSSEIVKQWDGACVNSYGPTEAAFCTTIYPVNSQSNTSVIGKPFPSTCFAVFSSRTAEALPILAIGELYIGGAQLAREYLGRSTLTSEKFVLKNGQRFYRSGDIVRMLSTGDFEFVGRADDQVKIRGLRVELGEINQVLCDSHPEVIAVVAKILKKSKKTKEQLVAFIAMSDPKNETKSAEVRRSLIQAAKACLPSYMVPQFFLFVDKIPKSQAGKVDKRALVELFHHFASTESSPNGNINQTHQWTSLEMQIRHAFAQFARIPEKDIFATTSIYELGLDSISAVQIAAVLRREGHHVMAEDVMKYMTCIDIASHIDKPDPINQLEMNHYDFLAFENLYRRSILAACHAAEEDVEAIRPCTSLQKGILSQFLSREGATYFNHLRFELGPNVHLDSMRQAWETVMNKHQMLRTGFMLLNKKDHPFVMIQYKPSKIKLPWTIEKDTNPSMNLEDWLRKSEQRAVSELHQPSWHIREIHDDGIVYLDLAILHALYDAQSLQMIFNDVAATYMGKCLSPSRPLDPILNSIIQLANDESKQGEAFWARLGRESQPCRFPNLSPLRIDPEPPASWSHFSKMSLPTLESGCRAKNTTLQAVGMASWMSLLSAYTGEGTVTCGLVLSGRNFEAAEDAVFPCINTVPVIYDCRSNQEHTLRGITALLADVQRYQHLSLNNIQRIMGHPEQPLFDTIFAFQKMPHDNQDNGLWKVIEDHGSTEYRVSIELEPKHNRLEYRLTSLPHIVPNESATLILEQLDHLVQCFLSKEPIGNKHPLLYSITPPEIYTLPSKAKLLHELVELTTEEHPERIALDFAHSIQHDKYSSRKWTYSDLNAEANKVANLLLETGVKPGDLVGVCFEKCPEASFAMLGILKAGCAFVAIDPGAPATRQSFITQDSKATAILSMEAQSSKFRDAVHVPILDLDKISLGSYSNQKPQLANPLDPQCRSYCLYTSGTTGTPKGCEITHENTVQALQAFSQLFDGHWQAESRWLQFASFHFDVSVLEQFWSWSVGICVVSAPRDVIFEDLANSICTLGITHIDLTPSLAHILHPDDVPSLCEGVFITGGESLKQEILDVWGPKSVIYNGYGPTEATIGCTMYPRVPANGKPSNIGCQFANVGTLVLHPNSAEPVLRGAIGELCVYGKLVGKGYLNRKDLTARSFPHLENFGERVYRTGDLVRILHDGSFEFLGRADDQVKLRGQRLEIGEINSVIKQSNQNVTDAATLVLKHPQQQKDQLVAFVIMRGFSKSDTLLVQDNIAGMRKAKEACQDRLPPYMVPTHFVPLTTLPLNINNKADTRRLREIYEGLSVNDLQKLSVDMSNVDLTWSTVDEKLRDVIKAQIGIDESSITKNSNFFELGMDSISAIGVVRALKQAGFSGATTSLVLNNPNIRRLSRALSTDETSAKMRGSSLVAQQVIIAMEHRHRRAILRTLDINPSQLEALAPCTPLQQGMIANYLDSDNGVYFNTFKFALKGAIDYDKLRSAWETVHAATQILRTVFVNTEDGYMQAVLHEKKLPWLLDCTIKSESLEDGVRRLKSNWLRQNQIELARPFEIIDFMAGQRRFLIVHIFHGLYDGISIEIIFNAIWTIYNRRDIDIDAPLFQSVLAHGPLRKVDGAKRFWREHITSNESKLFPLRSNKSTISSAKVVQRLDSLSAFENIRRKLNVSAQAIAQACWVHVLGQYLKSTITTGVVVSGRSIDLAGADRVIGPMFNTIPYQHQHRPKEAWASIIKRVHDFNVAAHPYQQTPLRDITKWCRKNQGNPLFDTLFVYQAAQDQEPWMKNEFWELEDDEAEADYPLAFEIEQHSDNSWTLTLLAQGYVFNEQELKELLTCYVDALKEAVSNPETTVTFDHAVNGIANGAILEEKIETNGHNGITHFEWTDKALQLRDALANLSGSEVEHITPSTSIFELGLDSIDAIKLSSKLKKNHIELPVSAIMRGQTVEKIISNMSQTDNFMEIDHGFDTDLEERKRVLEEYFDKHEIAIAKVDDILPLTPLQEAMVAEMIASGFTRYYNFDVLVLGKDTDLTTLQESWAQVVAASPILRTSFKEVEDPSLESTFAQFVHSQPHDFWKQVEIEGEPRFASIFEQIRKKAATDPFSKPPFEILVINSPVQVYLVLAIAHALYDGWSLGLLHSDVKRAYQGMFIPRPDYQKTLSQILSTSGADAADFWADYLANTKPSKFPRVNVTSNASPATYRREQCSTIPLAEVEKFSKKSNVSLQTVGQTVFAIVCGYYTRALDVTFGAVLSGRDDEISSQLLFPTMNTVAVRTIIHGTRFDILRHVQNNFTSIKQWQHFPLRKALALTGAQGGIFEGLFIFQKSTEVSENKVQLYDSIESYSDVEYPICVEMEMVQGQLLWRCAVKETVLGDSGTQELLNKLDQVLQEIIEHPEELVIDFNSHGISMCGLPAFKQTGKNNNHLESKEPSQEQQPQPHTICAIREVLSIVSGTPEADITNDMTIFHIGLDSISAIKVSSLLRKRGIALSVGDMIREGTIDNIARIADSSSSRTGKDTSDYASVISAALQTVNCVDVLNRVQSEGATRENSAATHILPLPAGQLYMLSMWLNTKGSNFYAEFQYKLNGPATLETINRAWKDIVKHYPILRSQIFATHDRTIPYVQIVRSDKEVVPDTVDITGISEEERFSIVSRKAMEQPWAHLFVSKSSIGWDLTLRIHHALYDGVSLPHLVQRLEDSCNGVPSDAVENSFPRYVAACYSYKASGVCKTFWTQYLDGLQQHLLRQPDDLTTGKLQIFKPSVLSTGALELTARGHGISIQSLFLAAYAKLYAILSQTPEEQDTVIGIYFANRSLDIEGIQSAAFPTVNLLPLRVRRPIEQNLLVAAIQIQADLQNISQISNVSASLYEIHEWTSIKVDTFVNFLTLPNLDTTQEASSKQAHIEISQIGQWDEEVAQVTNSSAGTFETADIVDLVDERVKQTYLVSN